MSFIVNPENICTPPVGAVSNRTEFGVKVITESTIIKYFGNSLLPPDPVGAVSNRGPRPLLGREVPTRYWEGTPDIVGKLPN